LGTPATANPTPSTAEQLQAGFLRLVLPRVLAHCEVDFRYQRSADRRTEWAAEAAALAWLWYVRLRRQGRDVAAFPTALATFAARAARCGRRLCGQENGKDVLSPRARRRHGFAVGRLPDFDTVSAGPLAEALVDNTQTPVPEQVSAIR
jgi:hypothetical protein